MNSPYRNLRSSRWIEITNKLVKKHPLSINEIKEITLESWTEIFRSRIGKKPYRIGKDIMPKPQIMGFLLHELIALAVEKKYPGKWRREKYTKDKDIIYIPNDMFSIEIKTSSNPKNIFGNRSYTQKTKSNKKTKSGFYLAVNFEKFHNNIIMPKILKIRFGWLDHKDWIGQKAATGQQARLSKEIEEKKLLELYTIK